MPRIPAAERPRLTLEDYIVFFTSRSGKGLSIDHLNQIIYMHGFAKVHRAPKPAIVDSLRSIELMRPRRSTVPLNATAPPPGAAPALAAALSVDEATRDIDDIGWRECPVGSLLSIRAGVMSPLPPAMPAAAAAETPVPISVIVPGSAERISPPSQLSASSPLPPAMPAAETPVPISVIVPGSAEGISPPSQLSASSPLPPALSAAARKKGSSTGKGKAAARTKRRRVVELLTIPSVEMATFS